jgi:hypothetical protein
MVSKTEEMPTSGRRFTAGRDDGGGCPISQPRAAVKKETMSVSLEAVWIFQMAPNAAELLPSFVKSPGFGMLIPRVLWANPSFFIFPVTAASAFISLW